MQKASNTVTKLGCMLLTAASLMALCIAPGFASSTSKTTDEKPAVAADVPKAEVVQAPKEDPTVPPSTSIADPKNKPGTGTAPIPWVATGIEGLPSVDCSKEQGKLPMYIDALTKGDEPIRRDAILRCLGYAVASRSGQPVEKPAEPKPVPAAPVVAPEAVTAEDAKADDADKPRIPSEEEAEAKRLAELARDEAERKRAAENDPLEKAVKQVDCANAQGKVAAHVTTLVGMGTQAGRDAAMLCIARAIAAQSGQPIEEPKLTPPGSPKPVENVMPKADPLPKPSAAAKALKEKADKAAKAEKEAKEKAEKSKAEKPKAEKPKTQPAKDKE